MVILRLLGTFAAFFVSRRAPVPGWTRRRQGGLRSWGTTKASNHGDRPAYPPRRPLHWRVLIGDGRRLFTFFQHRGATDTQPPVVVLPPASDSGRRVAIHGERVGTAYNLFDVLDFLHDAGLPADGRTVDDPELIEWRGGGPYDWNNTAPPHHADSTDGPGWRPPDPRRTIWTTTSSPRTREHGCNATDGRPLSNGDDLVGVSGRLAILRVCDERQHSRSHTAAASCETSDPVLAGGRAQCRRVDAPLGIRRRPRPSRRYRWWYRCAVGPGAGPGQVSGVRGGAA